MSGARRDGADRRISVQITVRADHCPGRRPSGMLRGSWTVSQPSAFSLHGVAVGHGSRGGGRLWQVAQLSDDCFAFGGELMRVAEALAILAERIDVTAGVETVPLPQALNRFLASDLVSRRAVPPHDNAAVDGYAVFFDDLEPAQETRLRIEIGRASCRERVCQYV